MVSTDYTVADVPGQQRFEIRAGDELAGYTAYRRSSGVIAFIHTEVEPEFKGRGVGGRLIAGALDAVRGEGRKVLPFCPFVRGFIAKHADEYLDLVPAERRADFDLA
jgi:uncharacterized protein